MAAGGSGPVEVGEGMGIRTWICMGRFLVRRGEAPVRDSEAVAGEISGYGSTSNAG